MKIPAIEGSIATRPALGRSPVATHGAAMLMVTTALHVLASHAQTAAPPSAPSTPVAPRAFPSVDTTKALAGRELIEALRNGGFVFYLRHTETGAITEECTVSNLSPKGATMARELGMRLTQLGIPIGRLVSSPVCRVQETAKLLDLGETELSDDLLNVPKSPGIDLHAARMRQLALAPRPGTNTLAVSHMHAGENPEHAMDLEFGEVIVFRPMGNSGSVPVARIRAQDWRAFASAKSAVK